MQSARPSALSSCLVAACLLMLSGCSFLFQKPSVPVVDEADEVTGARRDQLLARWDAAGDLKSATVHYRVDLSRLGFSESVELATALSRPERMRLDVFAPGVHDLLAVVLVRENAVIGYDASRRAYFAGEVEESKVPVMWGVPLDAEAVAFVLLGRKPAGTAESLRLYQKNPASTLVASYSSGKLKFQCAMAESKDAATSALAPSQCHITDSRTGDSVALVKHIARNAGKPEAATGAETPCPLQPVTVYLETEGITARLTPLECSLSPAPLALDDRRFRFELPEGAPLIPLEEVFAPEKPATPQGKE